MNYQLIAPIKTHSITEQIFYNRGFLNSDDITHYLNLNESDDLGFDKIDNLHQGAQMLIKHLAANNDVFIQVDPDVDGYTSAAILLNYLYRLFPDSVKNHFYYNVQDNKNHGIEGQDIPDNFKLVIAPDSSSNDYETHLQLKSRGVDVLVIDHHNADYVSPNACVINNQLCEYPNKTLSGAGMVYKFCRYLDKINNTDIAKDFIDLAALGVVSDMMDIRDFETRYFINEGSKNVLNPFFRQMVIENNYSLKDKVNPIGISFYITPYINACIRVGTIEEKKNLFESMLIFKADEEIPSTKRGEKGLFETRVTQAVRTCKNSKNRQKATQDKAVEEIEKIIEEQDLLKNKILFIQIEDDLMIDKNLTGLIANKLMSKYQRPVLILRKTNRDDIVRWEGSGRGYSKSGFDNFQGFLKDSGYFEYADGHENAFGRGIADEYVENFINYSNTELNNFDFSPKYNVDFIFDAKNFLASAIEEIANLDDLWGQGMTEPMVALENVKITEDNLFLLKGSTLKFSILDNQGRKIEFIKFGSSEEEYNSLKPATSIGYTQINLVGKCSINSYMGINTPQIKLEDFEIKRAFAYDF